MLDNLHNDLTNLFVGTKISISQLEIKTIRTLTNMLKFWIVTIEKPEGGTFIFDNKVFTRKENALTTASLPQEVFEPGDIIECIECISNKSLSERFI